MTVDTTTAFVSNITTIGTATVPTEGSISVLNISVTVTHAATISYVINPNSEIIGISIFVAAVRVL